MSLQPTEQDKVTWIDLKPQFLIIFISYQYRKGVSTYVDLWSIQSLLVYNSNKRKHIFNKKSMVLMVLSTSKYECLNSGKSS